jgi:hypothetical protein
VILLVIDGDRGGIDRCEAERRAEAQPSPSPEGEAQCAGLRYPARTATTILSTLCSGAPCSEGMTWVSPTAHADDEAVARELD